MTKLARTNKPTKNSANHAKQQDVPDIKFIKMISSLNELPPWYGQRLLLGKVYKGQVTV